MDDPDQPQLIANAAPTTEASPSTVAPDPGAAPEDAPTDTSGALIVFIIAVGSALIFSFLCSIFESVLLSVSRGHVEAMAKQGSRAGKILRRWKRSDIEVPVAAILILNTIAHTVGSTVAGSSYEGAFGKGTLAYFSIVFTIAILLFTEIIPKTVGVAFANKLAGPVTLAVQGLVYFLYPFLKITSWISRKLTGEHKKPVTSIEEIRLLAAIGSHEGDVGPRFAAFIDGIASLAELTVHDVMVPRVSIAYLSGEKSFSDNLEVVRKSGHSRFPFTPSGDLDDVQGIVLAKELLFFDHDTPEGTEPKPNWEELQSPLLVVPETKHLDQVLRLFQAERKHLAVVVDEYGGTQGVLTLEDVLEEIVGEIEDETDRVERHIVKTSKGNYRCRATAETRKLFKVVGIEEKVDSVTMGGFVADLLGHVPKVGDIAEWKNLRIEVEKASRRRAEQLVVRVVEKAAPSEEG